MRGTAESFVSRLESIVKSTKFSTVPVVNIPRFKKLKKGWISGCMIEKTE